MFRYLYENITGQSLRPGTVLRGAVLAESARDYEGEPPGLSTLTNPVCNLPQLTNIAFSGYSFCNLIGFL